MGTLGRVDGGPSGPYPQPTSAIAAKASSQGATAMLKQETLRDADKLVRRGGKAGLVAAARLLGLVSGNGALGSEAAAPNQSVLSMASTLGSEEATLRELVREAVRGFVDYDEGDAVEISQAVTSALQGGSALLSLPEGLGVEPRTATASFLPGKQSASRGGTAGSHAGAAGRAGSPPTSHGSRSPGGSGEGEGGGGGESRSLCLLLFPPKGSPPLPCCSPCTPVVFPGAPVGSSC